MNRTGFVRVGCNEEIRHTWLIDSDSLIVVFDDGGDFVAYESTADLEASMERAMAAEEP